MAELPLAVLPPLLAAGAPLPPHLYCCAGCSCVLTHGTYTNSSGSTTRPADWYVLHLEMSPKKLSEKLKRNLELPMSLMPRVKLLREKYGLDPVYHDPAGKPYALYKQHMSDTGSFRFCFQCCENTRYNRTPPFCLASGLLLAFSDELPPLTQLERNVISCYRGYGTVVKIKANAKMCGLQSHVIFLKQDRRSPAV